MLTTLLETSGLSAVQSQLRHDAEQLRGLHASVADEPAPLVVDGVTCDSMDQCESIHKMLENTVGEYRQSQHNMREKASARQTEVRTASDRVAALRRDLAAKKAALASLQDQENKEHGSIHTALHWYQDAVSQLSLLAGVEVVSPQRGNGSGPADQLVLRLNFDPSDVEEYGVDLRRAKIPDSHEVHLGLRGSAVTSLALTPAAVQVADLLPPLAADTAALGDCLNTIRHRIWSRVLCAEELRSVRRRFAWSEGVSSGSGSGSAGRSIQVVLTPSCSVTLHVPSEYPLGAAPTITHMSLMGAQGSAEGVRAVQQAAYALSCPSLSALLHECHKLVTAQNEGL